ncbi:MAG: DNA-directed RNA polymerase subunit P [Candidatus Micrarchaeota archaeon]
MTFVCSKCGKEFEYKDLEFVRCLYCDSKVLFKKTPPVAKRVQVD